MSAYRRDFDKSKCISFLIKDDKLLEKYNEFWEKLTNIIKKEFDSNSVYIGKYIKTKIKVYNKKVNTNFHGNKMPKESLECVCLSVVLLDLVLKKDYKYCTQVFLEECKHAVKEKKIRSYIVVMQKFLLILVKKIYWKKVQKEKNFDYKGISDEETIEKNQMEKSSDEEN